MTFNPERVVDIHEELSINHKIEPGYKDKDIIGSIIYKINARINNQELYPDVYLKAASLFEGIIRFHPFIDGNKRTALASLQEFLLENDVIFIIPYSAVRFAVKVARQSSLDQDGIENLIHNISKWIKYRSYEGLKIRRLQKLLKFDIGLIENIEKIAKKKKNPSMVATTIDYWLAKDIYPDSDITFEQMVDFQMERAHHIIQFYRSKLKN